MIYKRNKLSPLFYMLIIQSFLQLVHPAFVSQLGHLRVKSLQTFKSQLEQLLRRGEAFAASVRTCSESCITEFDKGCSGTST